MAQTSGKRIVRMPCAAPGVTCGLADGLNWDQDSPFDLVDAPAWHRIAIELGHRPLRATKETLFQGQQNPACRDVLPLRLIRTAAPQARCLYSPFPAARLHGPGRARVEKEAGGTWNEIVGPKNDGHEAVVEIAW
jgi:hypothetical protein